MFSRLNDHWWANEPAAKAFWEVNYRGKLRSLEGQNSGILRDEMGREQMVPNHSKLYDLLEQRGFCFAFCLFVCFQARVSSM